MITFEKSSHTVPAPIVLVSTICSANKKCGDDSFSPAAVNEKLVDLCLVKCVTSKCAIILSDLLLKITARWVMLKENVP